MLKKETADDRVEKVVRLFSKLKNANLFLDIGCGNGGITCRIKDSINAKHTYGVDVAKSSLVSARERGIQPIMIDIDSGDLPFRDGSFEAIYCGEVIEHLRDTDHLLGEVHRVLAQDGICVLDTPNLASWHGRIELLLGYQPSYTLVSTMHNVGKLVSGIDWEPQSEKPHHWVFTFRALSELVSVHGYEITKAAGAADFNIRYPLSIVDRLCARSPRLGTYIVVMLAKKSPQE